MYKLFLFFGALLILTGISLPPPPAEADSAYRIVISKETNQLALIESEKIVKVFPVATGRKQSYTPEGTFTIVAKIINPYYGKLNISGGSPRNPLGPRWLGLSIGGGGVYGIHGNNHPASIGTYASAGCIRMFNEDVIWLYDQISIGTPVTITSSPLPVLGRKNPITVVMNNVELEIPPVQEAFIKNSEVYLPLRRIMEGCGHDITWDTREQRLYIFTPRGKITVVPGSHIVNGEKGRYSLNNPPLHRANSVYMPLSFFREVLDFTISFDGQSQRVIMVTNK